MCSEPQRPLTLGTTSARRPGGAAAAPPASDVETAKGSLLFISRVLTQAQHAAEQRSSELLAEQEKHAATRNRLRRVDAERADAVDQLAAAVQELQRERARCEQLKLALADERAAHAQTEQARQRALDRLNSSDPEQQQTATADRRQSAAGVGSALSRAREQNALNAVSPAAAVSPRQLEPERSLADATRTLDTPFRNSVSILQRRLANSTQHSVDSHGGALAATSRQSEQSEPDSTEHNDVSFSADDWTGGQDVENSERRSSSNEEGSGDSPVSASPRPVRTRNAPHRWQDGNYLAFVLPV